MTNKGSTLILTILEEAHLWNIHTKLEAKLCTGVTEEVEKVKIQDNKDDGHNVIAIKSPTHPCK